MAPSISNCPRREVPWDISFSGSGFLATYQLGVSLCFLKYAPWILRSATFILGASAGSLIAAAVVCDMNLVSIRDEMLLFAKHLTTITLGPLNPSVSVFRWLEVVLQKYLPSDAHHRASGRLGVAVTRLTDGKQLIVSEFQSREEVVQSLLCSCFVPGYSGFLPPTFRGVRYIDGGLSGIQPRLPDSSSHTLTVCPYSGDTDICPADPPCVFEMVVDGTLLNFNMTNALRILNSLCPMTLEVRFMLSATVFLLGSMTTYLSMLGLPVRIFSTLFLPLVVSFYALLQSRQRNKGIEVQEFSGSQRK
ncbi:patatin-like phospholipase domain-containing protein 2 [Xenentodon cancila]